MNKTVLLLQKLASKYEIPPDEIEMIIKSIPEQKNSSIKKPVSKEKSNSIKRSKLDIEEIRTIFTENDANKLNQKFTATELKDIYFSVYDSKPRSGESKIDLINDIQNYFYAINRTLAFNMI